MEMMDFTRQELIDEIKDKGFERTLRDKLNFGADNDIMIEVLMEYLILLEEQCQKQAHKIHMMECKLCQ